ncbi:MAG: AbrB/MazE/SpoVT family DNA-binding domain-containing protein [Microthrixaceae bacterium]|nr:AbrB/MazE/SpoVT family DNA-binding domain-containing protein [Microthrixaceae bacterium]
MRVTEKGQVTIPKELRDTLGIGAGTEVELELVEQCHGRGRRGRTVDREHDQHLRGVDRLLDHRSSR